MLEQLCTYSRFNSQLHERFSNLPEIHNDSLPNVGELSPASYARAKELHQTQHPFVHGNIDERYHYWLYLKDVVAVGNRTELTPYWVSEGRQTPESTLLARTRVYLYQKGRRGGLFRLPYALRCVDTPSTSLLSGCQGHLP